MDKMTKDGLTQYEVTFSADDHTWSANYWAENFGHAEEQALNTLKSNKDDTSVIFQIELW